MGLFCLAKYWSCQIPKEIWLVTNILYLSQTRIKTNISKVISNLVNHDMLYDVLITKLILISILCIRNPESKSGLVVIMNN